MASNRIDMFAGGIFPQPSKPRLFVSYHHGNDQAWYDAFVKYFGTANEVFTDRSLDRRIDSANHDYTMSVIRGEYIKGTSVTIVLCGTETWKRKYVDWEVKATLDKQHALLAVILPTNTGNLVPQRLYDNVQSGYAAWTNWTDSPKMLSLAIQETKTAAQNTRLIVNRREIMQRNAS